jgi:hypothetical protein
METCLNILTWAAEIARARILLEKVACKNAFNAKDTVLSIELFYRCAGVRNLGYQLSIQIKCASGSNADMRYTLVLD